MSEPGRGKGASDGQQLPGRAAHVEDAERVGGSAGAKATKDEDAATRRLMYGSVGFVNVVGGRISTRDRRGSGDVGLSPGGCGDGETQAEWSGAWGEGEVEESDVVDVAEVVATSEPSENE